ncbi:MAG: AMP-binding protein, partial [Polyangiaceae bacterium]|nr:AMP-binding protein [Polyangiaceae bacterium]
MTGSWRLRGDELAARGGAIALASRGATLTYAELAGRAAAVWRWLRRVGVLPGDPVALLSTGRALDEPVALTGALTLGAAVVPLDATAPPARLARVLRARACRALITDAAAAPLAGAVFTELGEAAPAWVEVDPEGRALRGGPARAGAPRGGSGAERGSSARSPRASGGSGAERG